MARNQKINPQAVIRDQFSAYEDPRFKDEGVTYDDYGRQFDELIHRHNNEVRVQVLEEISSDLENEMSGVNWKGQSAEYDALWRFKQKLDARIKEEKDNLK